jgi:hypothetical protein
MQPVAMAENDGARRLEARIEFDLLERSVLGPTVIVLGEASEHARESLARLGHRVTVVESPQAPFDGACSPEAETPTDRGCGQGERLPADDGEYDTLLTMYGPMDVPGLVALMPESTRVVRPNGNLVFIMRPREAAPLPGTGSPGDSEPDRFCNDQRRARPGAHELVAAADSMGLTIVDVGAYGALLGGGACNRLSAIATSYSWRRLLSWLAIDDRLFDFALFLEHELFGRLPVSLMERSVAVMTRHRDPGRNNAWLTAHDAAEARLTGGMTKDTLGSCLRISPGEFTTRLNAYLRESLRNFRLFDLLHQGLTTTDASVGISAFLETDMLQRLEDWDRRRNLDREVTVQTREWTAAPGVARCLRWHGVSLDDTLEYYLGEDLLTGYHGLFSESDS